MKATGIYFWDGFQHCIFGLSFALVLYLLLGKKLTFTKSFWAALVMGASALFFLPPEIRFVPGFNWKVWLFLRYPLPDWDVLFLGMGWHRYFIFHSIILPLILFYEISPKPKFFQVASPPTKTDPFLPDRIDPHQEHDLEHRAHEMAMAG